MEANEFLALCLMNGTWSIEEKMNKNVYSCYTGIFYIYIRWVYINTYFNFYLDRQLMGLVAMSNVQIKTCKNIECLHFVYCHTSHYFDWTVCIHGGHGLFYFNLCHMFDCNMLCVHFDWYLSTLDVRRIQSKIGGENFFAENFQFSFSNDKIVNFVAQWNKRRVIWVL